MIIAFYDKFGAIIGVEADTSPDVERILDVMEWVDVVDDNFVRYKTFQDLDLTYIEEITPHLSGLGLPDQASVFSHCVPKIKDLDYYALVPEDGDLKVLPIRLPDAMKILKTQITYH